MTKQRRKYIGHWCVDVLLAMNAQGIIREAVNSRTKNLTEYSVCFFKIGNRARMPCSPKAALALTNASHPLAVSKETAVSDVWFDPADLLFYSFLGGYAIQRYLPNVKLLQTVACGLVGAYSNQVSWVSNQGVPLAPVVYGGIFAAILPNLYDFRHPMISGVVGGSLIYSLYYASSRRGVIHDEQSVKSLEFF